MKFGATHSSSQCRSDLIGNALLPVANRLKRRPLDLLPQRALFVLPGGITKNNGID